MVRCWRTLEKKKHLVAQEGRIQWEGTGVVLRSAPTAHKIQSVTRLAFAREMAEQLLSVVLFLNEFVCIPISPCSTRQKTYSTFWGLFGAHNSKSLHDLISDTFMLWLNLCFSVILTGNQCSNYQHHRLLERLLKNKEKIMYNGLYVFAIPRPTISK